MTESKVLTLFVTDNPRMPAPAGFLAQIRLDQLGRETLQQIAPQTVACRLFQGHIDAKMVAEILQALGFDGKLLVLTPKLPRSSMVLRELRQSAPTVQIDLMEITE